MLVLAPTRFHHARLPLAQYLGDQCKDVWSTSNASAIADVSIAVNAVNAQVASLQAQLNSVTNPANNSKPFDSAKCLATDIKSFKTDSAAGTRWVAVDFSRAAEAACSRSVTGDTCSSVCARIGSKCDPCAIAKVSCHDALYYALKEAGADTAFTQALLLQDPPGEPGPWAQSVCAATGVAQQADFNTPYQKAFGWAQALCDATGPAITTDFYSSLKNYWLPALASSYINPATLCDIPIVKMDQSDIISFSGLCFCSKVQ